MHLIVGGSLKGNIRFIMATKLTALAAQLLKQGQPGFFLVSSFDIKVTIILDCNCRNMHSSFLVDFPILYTELTE